MSDDWYEETSENGLELRLIEGTEQYKWKRIYEHVVLCQLLIGAAAFVLFLVFVE